MITGNNDILNRKLRSIIGSFKLVLLALLLGCFSSSSAQQWIDYSNKGMYWQYCVEIDKSSNVWVGSKNGATKIAEDTSIRYDESSSGLPQDDYTGAIDVYDIIEDDSGNYWFGSQYGLTKYDGENWKTFGDPREGRTGRIVKAIAIGKDKNIWIGTGGGLAKYDRNEMIAISDVNGNVKDLEIDESGNVWVGTYDYNGDYEGVVRYDGSKITRFNADNSNLPKGGVWDIEIDESGVVWAGTKTGIGIYENEEWRVLDTSNSQLPGNYIEALEIDENGTIWIASYFYEDNPVGLVKYNKNQWKTFDTTNTKMELNHVNDIAINDNGNIWVTTYKYNDITSRVKGGLYKYRRNKTSFKALTVSKNIFKVYPNPAQDQLKIQAPTQAQTYTLRNLTGQKAQSGKLNGKGTHTVNVSNLSPGVYLLQVQGADAVRTKKVVIE